MKRINASVIHYFVNQGLLVLPYRDGEKHPALKDWAHHPLSMDDVNVKHADQYLSNNGHGAGLLPDGTWGFFDLDSDHGEGVTIEDVVKPLQAIFGDDADLLHKTLIAKKPGVDNYHLFFGTSASLHAKYTGNRQLAPGLEFANFGAPVRISDYQFLNLDTSLPFTSQIIYLPDHVERFLQSLSEDVSATSNRPAVKYTATHTGNVRERLTRYLSKVTPPKVGTRHNTYRRLLITLVNKDGFQFDEVKAALVDFDKKTGVNQQTLDPSGFWSVFSDLPDPQK